MGDLSTHFSRREFKCTCGCGFGIVDAELVNILEVVRAHFKRAKPNMNIKMKITSGCRCKEHNREVGGSSTSWHVLGGACDFYIYCADTGIRVPEEEVYEFLDSTYPKGYGIGRYKGRNHVDIRPDRIRWDKR